MSDFKFYAIFIGAILLGMLLVTLLWVPAHIAYHEYERWAYCTFSSHPYGWSCPDD